MLLLEALELVLLELLELVLLQGLVVVPLLLPSPRLLTLLARLLLFALQVSVTRLLVAVCDIER